MNKEGSAMVESAMVFPLIIFTLMALIYMMIFFYDQLGHKVDMHMMLRAESGKMCENMFYGNTQETGFNVYKDRQQISSYGTVVSEKKWLLAERKKEFSARKYLIDEAGFVRMTDAIADGVTDDQQ